MCSLLKSGRGSGFDASPTTLKYQSSPEARSCSLQFIGFPSPDDAYLLGLSGGEQDGSTNRLFFPGARTPLHGQTCSFGVTRSRLDLYASSCGCAEWEFR
jgi:hypothetical protein